MKYIAYYRVSTKRQGQSGLGLEGQRNAVAQYKPVAEFVEVETGTNKKERPELAKAIRECKRRRATLVIAKLDRLARNVHFVSGLMESGIEFVCVDMPTANRLTIHILAAVAEEEARAISQRTKSALSAYKARGGLLGASRKECQNLTDKARREGQRAGNEANSRAASEFKQDLPVAELRASGMTLKEIAEHLNREGYRTRRGKGFTATAVHRILAG